ncbi:hypothetical protein LU290_06830 [Moraxella nasibovis]|uniref:hypothetical protein n=1 Tax=Moraxella nasibovis TaxID=2904120 RepID=UPI002410245D|nr:hypothetical protein [Moraxella nasibovis]WFF37974.1 hypothetical protein LU290_06830 [Moraxella nasibovis]
MLKRKITAIFMAMIACQSVFANNEQNQQIAEKVAYIHAGGTIFNQLLNTEYQKLDKQNIPIAKKQIFECLLNHSNDTTYAQFLLPLIADFMQNKTKSEIQAYQAALSDKKLLELVRNISLSKSGMTNYGTDYYTKQLKMYENVENVTVLYKLATLGGATTSQAEYLGRRMSDEYTGYILRECNMFNLQGA